MFGGDAYFVSGSVRIIRIDDYDACFCIGKHVTPTAEIGKFRITGTSYEDSVLIIRFKLTQNSEQTRLISGLSDKN